MTYITFLFCHSRENGNPDPTGSPIRSALLSVEDDKGCVIPVSPLCHSRENGNPVCNLQIPNPKRLAFGWGWQRVGHSRENGNPDRAGSRIKCGMTKRNVDPQSEALCFRLRTARGWNNILCKWCYLVIFVGYGISTQLAIIINQNAQKQIWN